MAVYQGLRDRVVIVTGGGRGIGREHCLALGAAGARVVVNDLGVDLRGEGADPSVARGVAEEINAAGGVAIASSHDVSDAAESLALVEEVLTAFGEIHGLVNNAGIVRDSMFVNITPEDWDASIRGCLRSHYNLSYELAKYWRAEHKAGRTLHPRIVNTTSGAGLFGSVGQANYSAAKAAIAALTIVQAAELGRYGIKVNALAPVARTRLTEDLFREAMATQDTGFDRMHPSNISPFALWLVSLDNHDVTGRVFEVDGETVTVCMNWHRGPSIAVGPYTIASAGEAVCELNAESPDRVPVYA